VPFEGTTTFQDHYVRHPLAASQTLKPRPAGQPRPDDRDFNTTFRDSYQRPPQVAVEVSEHEKRLRIIVDRNASVEQVKKAMMDRTRIDLDHQRLNRKKDGRSLDQLNLSASWVDSLGWRSGEECSLVYKSGAGTPVRR